MADVKVKQPKLEEVEKYLKEYGWNYRKTQSEDGDFLVAPLLLPNEKGILTTFSVSGEFVMVSTYKFLTKVSAKESAEFLKLNDKIKLAKLFCVESENENLEVEVGFELWAESWNKETFFAFLDMFSLGVEKVFEFVKENGIEHEVEYIKTEE